MKWLQEESKVRKKGHMMMQAEFKVSKPQSREWGQPLESRRIKKQIPPRLSKRNQPWKHLDFSHETHFRLLPL